MLGKLPMQTAGLTMDAFENSLDGFHNDWHEFKALFSAFGSLTL